MAPQLRDIGYSSPSYNSSHSQIRYKQAEALFASLAAVSMIGIAGISVLLSNYPGKSDKDGYEDKKGEISLDKLLSLFIGQTIENEATHLDRTTVKVSLKNHLKFIPEDALDRWIANMPQKFLAKLAVIPRELSTFFSKESLSKKAVHFFLDDLLPTLRVYNDPEIKEGFAWDLYASHKALKKEIDKILIERDEGCIVDILAKFQAFHDTGTKYASYLMYACILKSADEKLYKEFIEDLGETFAFFMENLPEGSGTFFPIGWNEHCVEIFVEKTNGQYAVTVFDTAFFLQRALGTSTKLSFIHFSQPKKEILEDPTFWVLMIDAKFSQDEKLLVSLLRAYFVDADAQFAEKISETGEVKKTITPYFEGPTQIGGTCTIRAQLAALHWFFLREASGTATGQALFEQALIEIQKNIWEEVKAKKLFSSKVRAVGQSHLDLLSQKWQAKSACKAIVLYRFDLKQLVPYTSRV